MFYYILEWPELHLRTEEGEVDPGNVKEIEKEDDRGPEKDETTEEKENGQLFITDEDFYITIRTF